MVNDYKECADMYNNGIEKDCSECSCNGGDSIGCIRENQEYLELDESILSEIALHYGYEKQSRQCIEECSELIQAINKFWRKFLDCGEKASFDFTAMMKNQEYQNLVEEIADVQIMLSQLKILLRCDLDVTKIADAKLNRQLERMKR